MEKLYRHKTNTSIRKKKEREGRGGEGHINLGVEGSLRGKTDRNETVQKIIYKEHTLTAHSPLVKTV